MDITVEISWKKTEFGYYECQILVYDQENILMRDIDMYYTIEKICMRINRLFVDNKRFTIHKVLYKKNIRTLYLECTDTKSKDEKISCN